MCPDFPGYTPLHGIHSLSVLKKALKRRVSLSDLVCRMVGWMNSLGDHNSPDSSGYTPLHGIHPYMVSLCLSFHESLSPIWCVGSLCLSFHESLSPIWCVGFRLSLSRLVSQVSCLSQSSISPIWCVGCRMGFSLSVGCRMGFSLRLASLSLRFGVSDVGWVFHSGWRVSLSDLVCRMSDGFFTQASLRRRRSC